MSIRCPQCRREGLPNFIRRTVYPNVGPPLDVISCRNCGHWLKSRLIVPVESKRKAPPQQRPDDARGRSLIEHGTHCPVRGCVGLFLPGPRGSRFGLCHACSQKLHVWSRTKRSTPPPLTCVNGVWLRRGEPLPGIPGEKPAAAEPVIMPHPRPRQQARGKGQGARGKGQGGR